MTVLAQTAGRSATPLPALQRIVHSLDASVPVYDVHTIEALYRGHATGLGAVIMTMIASIGFMGLAITLVGLYGLVSYAVNRRTREIGIRIAIGATHARILRMLLRQGLAPAWVGMGIGVVLSLLSSRMLVTVNESSAVFSPLVVAAILPVLAAVTLLAAFVPARRAAKTDPTVALRAE
jgi:ABC-type antimicrobial peptide transport system permease subunit